MHVLKMIRGEQDTHDQLYTGSTADVETPRWSGKCDRGRAMRGDPGCGACDKCEGYQAAKKQHAVVIRGVGADRRKRIGGVK